MSTKKCIFLKKKVQFVGHIVSEDGIEPDPDKVEVVLNWPKPDNPEKVRHGFIGYYRKFIKNFSKIARPFIDLMPVPEKKRKKRNKTTTSEFKWGAEQDTAFQKLKELVSSEPILGFPDYSKPFELHTDASGSGLGAILYQEQDRVKRVIAYASRALDKTEKNYPAHKLEFLALKWSVCDKFNEYLFGHGFTVLKDNNPLTYVLSSAKLDATGQSWVAALSAFDFDVLYRPENQNADADSLSRLPGVKESISLGAVSAICNIIHAQPHIYSLSTSDGLKEPQVPQVKIDVKEIQENDLIIQEWKHNIEKKKENHTEPLFATSQHTDGSMTIMISLKSKTEFYSGMLSSLEIQDNKSFSHSLKSHQFYILYIMIWDIPVEKEPHH